MLKTFINEENNEHKLLIEIMQNAALPYNTHKALWALKLMLLELQ